MKNLLSLLSLAALGLAAPAALAQSAPAAPAASVAPAAPAASSAPIGTTHTGGKAAACIGCHGIPGYRVAFPHVYHVPMIAGQNAKYLESALNAYKSGERKHPTMAAIASSLSDKDISELAAYYSKGGSGK